MSQECVVSIDKISQQIRTLVLKALIKIKMDGI